MQIQCSEPVREILRISVSCLCHLQSDLNISVFNLAAARWTSACCWDVVLSVLAALVWRSDPIFWNLSKFEFNSLTCPRILPLKDWFPFRETTVLILVIFATIASKTSLSFFVSRYCKISLNFPVKVDDTLSATLSVSCSFSKTVCTQLTTSPIEAPFDSTKKAFLCIFDLCLGVLPAFHMYQ